MPDTTTLMTDMHTAPPPTLSMPCTAATQGRPFASINLGDRAFVVGERDDMENALVFRAEAGGPWRCLSHTLEHGWLRIGADILQSDPEALMHFLTTHAVRQSGWYRVGEKITFDTLGTAWSVELTDETQAVVTLGEEAPRRADPRSATCADLREQAIEMLIAAYPDLPERFAAEIDHWAVRLASGGVVKPIL